MRQHNRKSGTKEYDLLANAVTSALAGGGTQRIQKQHDQGKLTARERIAYLADPGSFEELDQFRRPAKTDNADGASAVYGDGVVAGTIRIDGRPACVYAQDFTVQGGSLSRTQADTICKIMDLAAHSGIPIIALNDSGGARIQDGIDSLAGYGDIFFRNVQLSGIVPQITAILGPCAGGAVYSPAVQDFVIMNSTTSYMFVTGPKIVKKVIYEEVSSKQLGGASIHSRCSGVAHFTAEDDRGCIDIVRNLFSYLPLNNESEATRKPGPRSRKCRESRISTILPADPHKAYDVRMIIYQISDEGDFTEVASQYARNICVGFGRMDGFTVGFVANQPQEMAGVLDINASIKAARFIRFCDEFNIPIVTLVDVPGFMPGTDQEKRGIILHGAKLLYAYAESTVPRVTIILRKAYGGAYIIMNSRHLGGDFVYAYPDAEIAVMGAESAVELLYTKEAQQSADPAAFLEQKEKEYQRELTSPFRAAERGYIDQIIRPEETRHKILTALSILKTRKRSTATRKHGCMPL